MRTVVFTHVAVGASDRQPILGGRVKRPVYFSPGCPFKCIYPLGIIFGACEVAYSLISWCLGTGQVEERYGRGTPAFWEAITLDPSHCSALVAPV